MLYSSLGRVADLCQSHVMIRHAADEDCRNAMQWGWGGQEARSDLDDAQSAVQSQESFFLSLVKPGS